MATPPVWPQYAPPAPPEPTWPQARQPRNRWWITGTAVLVVAAGIAGAAVTYAVAGDYSGSRPSASSPSSAPTPTPQISSSDAAQAKQKLCHIFDVSTAGQQGTGGVRGEGGVVNTPIVLRAVNSASAVLNGLVPGVPADLAEIARKYVDATLDLTTAAMGETTASEVNRLTAARNDAINALADACGLPR